MLGSSACGSEVGPDFDVNVFMVQHVFKHARVAVQGHGLKGVGEIAVVDIGPRGHTRRHRTVQLRGIQTPLLARVSAKKVS